MKRVASERSPGALARGPSPSRSPLPGGGRGSSLARRARGFGLVFAALGLAAALHRTDDAGARAKPAAPAPVNAAHAPDDAHDSCDAPRATPASSAHATARPRLTRVRGGLADDTSPEPPDAELDPLQVDVARFVEVLRDDFPGLGRPAPTAAHERDALHYSPSMHARLNLLGERGHVQIASLSLFDRVGASDETRDEHEREARAFAATALAPEIAPEVLAFVRDDCPTTGEEVRTTTRRWERDGRALSIACHEHYGSVEMVATGAGVLLRWPVRLTLRVTQVDDSERGSR